MGETCLFLSQMYCYCEFCHYKTDMYKHLRFQSLEVHKAQEANVLYNMLVELTSSYRMSGTFQITHCNGFMCSI